MRYIKLIDKETYEEHKYSVSDELYAQVKKLCEKESAESKEMDMEI